MAELQALPPLFYEQLAALLMECEQAGHWPEPLRVAVVTLLPKEGATDWGGMRPITLLPLVYFMCELPLGGALLGAPRLMPGGVLPLGAGSRPLLTQPLLPRPLPRWPPR